MAPERRQCGENVLAATGHFDQPGQWYVARSGRHRQAAAHGEWRMADADGQAPLGALPAWQADDEKHGVVDDNGEVFGLPGL